MRLRVKGFTLIELLIVVAIIAILAAIAIPNFLEAQVRAKVVQTKANERSIATAIEAYRVDSNGATPAGAMNFNWIDRWGYWWVLTTPVPYMTRVPRDPFYRLWAEKINDPAWQVYFCPYDLWDVSIARAISKGVTAPGMWGPISSSMSGLPNKQWIDTYVIPACRNAGAKDAFSYFLRGWGPDYMGPGNQGGNTYVTSYDPTNGTVSGGNIFYFN